MSSVGPHIELSPAEKFFGLSARPFSLTPDLRFAYHSRSHTHALEQVTSALRRREGLVVVTGAVGTGKTMLCRSMLESFESRTFLSVILDPGLEVEDLLRKVLTDFGIMRQGDLPDAGPMSEVTRHQYVTTLQQFLGTLIPLQAHAVIMIDEAQRLNPRVLEEIRLLSNFETDQAKLLQIVLVGQPELDAVLRRPDMQQLNQRVARRCELQPLSESEVGDYIERRLTVAASPAALAGGLDAGIPDTVDLVRFSPAAVKTVATISGGIPRLVNTVCDRALEAAYERQLRVVDPDSVIAAAQRLHLDLPATLSLRRTAATPRQVAPIAAAIVLLAGGLWWWSSSRAPSTTPPPRRATAATPSTAAPSPAAEPSAAPPASTPPLLSAAPSPAPTGSTGASSAAPATVAPSGSTGASPAAIAKPGSTNAAPGGTLATAPGTFQITVAAFRTESRAQDVVTALSTMNVPATVRTDPAGMWFRVVAGPFPTREAAQAAQDTLTRQGYSGTIVSQIPASTR